MNEALAFNQFHGLEIEEVNEFLREVLGIEQGLESTDELQNPEVADRFKIQTLDQVNWAMRKLAAFKAKKNQTEALAKLEADRIEQWKLRQLRGVDQSVKFFEAMLAEYMLDRRGADPKFKSESTPYGRITFTKQQPEWKYSNEEAAADFLEAQGLEVHAKTVKAIADKTQFKKAVEIKRNVFVEYDESGQGVIIDYATVDVETGAITSMDYAVGGDSDVVFSTDTGELVANVEYRPAVVVVNAVYVVPGVDVTDRADKIDVKPEA